MAKYRVNQIGADMFIIEYRRLPMFQWLPTNEKGRPVNPFAPCELYLSREEAENKIKEYEEKRQRNQG